LQLERAALGRMMVAEPAESIGDGNSGITAGV
jgi:hypothetical protein